MTRANWGLIAQVAISLVLLALLVRQVPIHTLGEALRRVHPTTIVLALALTMVGYWGRAQRWSVLLARSGVELSAVGSYGLTLVGTFYGVITPGRLGEFARVLHLRSPSAQTLPSVVWDRVADVLLLEAMCLPAFACVPAWRGTLFGVYIAMVLATALVLAMLARTEVADTVARMLPFLRRPAQRWRAASDGVLSSRAFALSLAWGLFFYVFMYAAAWLLLRDLAPGTSALLLLGLPVIPLLGNLPIAFGGLGLREQVSAAVFGQVGAGAATGAAFSLLLFAVATLLPGIAGMIVSATPWMRAASREKAA